MSILCGTCGSSRTVGANHFSGFRDDGAGGSAGAGTRPAVARCALSGVAIKPVLAALAAQPGSVVLTVTGSWTGDTETRDVFTADSQMTTESKNYK